MNFEDQRSYFSIKKVRYRNDVEKVVCILDIVSRRIDLFERKTIKKGLTSNCQNK